ncbi:hypothetical protein NKJ40_14255 [Mesorhizobium sp. M0119]|uniref:hypothetical protein n=1 Tax=unclassified Mesorhizobium TaxID=325217 RepID=UPI003337CD11
MPHFTAVLFARFGHWLRLIKAGDKQPPDGERKTPTPMHLDAERNRLPPRDESFYWGWQYWSR